jgi:hypothetical protein
VLGWAILGKGPGQKCLSPLAEGPKWIDTVPVSRHLKHMIPCAVMVAALLLLAVTGVGAGSSWRPLLALVVCPLMMLSMMWAMRPGHTSQTDGDESQGVAATAATGSALEP